MTWYVSTDSREAVPMESDEEIMGAVRSVRDKSSEFFVIEPEPGSESDYIQASVWTKGVVLGASYVAEVRKPAGDGSRQWRLRTKDFPEIEEAVRSYVTGGSPVWRGWTDVTDELGDERRRGSAS